MRYFTFFLLLVLLTGCASYIQAPGVSGRVVDAQGDKPIANAEVTRAAVKRSWNVPQGLPPTTVRTGRFGRFRVPIERDWQFALGLRFHTTQSSFTPTFTITADGYVTTNITVLVSSNTHWRVDLGRVRLVPQ